MFHAKSCIAALAAAAATAAAVAVLPASGQTPAATSTQTLTFHSTQKPHDFLVQSQRPHKQSIGDRYVFTSTLHQAGKIVGRLEGDCLAVDRTYEVLDCQLVVFLHDGLLTLHGARVTRRSIPVVGGTRDDYAITGGTGAYAHASGTMTREEGAHGDTLTLTLTP
ncbi:MAG: hypothetical protein QOJ89_2171 [bacterium]|jgi:hypothetical protein